MAFYFNIKAHSDTSFNGKAGLALNDLSLPVDVLFNENSSCGEAVPLMDAKLYIQTPEGNVDSIEFKKGGNIILGHEDISDSPIVFDN